MIISNQIKPEYRDFYSSRSKTKFHLEKNGDELVLSKYNENGKLTPVKYKKYDKLATSLSISRLNGNKSDFSRINLENDSYENVSHFSKMTKHDKIVDIFISEFNFLLKGKEKISINKNGKKETKLIDIEKCSFDFSYNKTLGPLAKRYLKKLAEFMNK